MSTYDNAPPPADWVPPTGKHCGEYCWDRTCRFCGFPAGPLPLSDRIILGEN